MRQLFGTDGIRGIAGKELTADTAYMLGLAVAEVLTETENKRPNVLIGRDTRWSGEMFEAAIAAGLLAMGSDVTVLGVVPTPAVAYLVRYAKADAGIMISASHNPAEHNGLKVFNGSGFKLSDELEERVEEIILGKKKVTPVSGNKIGRFIRDSSLVDEYERHLKALLPEDGGNKRFLFDLSNGSAAITAGKVFDSSSARGFKADFISDRPDGMNINLDCGSTQIGALAKAVRDGNYDAGFAFDGDADRCLMVDENGDLIDGDQIIAALASDMKKKGTLRGNAAVVTKLTNLGFHLFCKENGIDVHVTDVGDRYVLENMLETGANVGGEQSGHIILTDYATTGDGEMTAAVCIGLLLAQKDRTASDIFGAMKRLPQVSVNCRVPNDKKKYVMVHPDVTEGVRKVSELLGERGRVLLRPSGTEALIRIMLEGDDPQTIEKLAKELENTICGLL